MKTKSAPNKIKSVDLTEASQSQDFAQQMKPKSIKRSNIGLITTVLSAVLIMGGAFFAIQYAKGNYRLTKQGFADKTGLLSANSFPTGAQVFINGQLATATDDTIYLEPGEYTVEIIKDGYSGWKKLLKIEETLVTQTNAQLFPSAPSLVPLTFTGVKNISPSPDGQKLIFYTASASSQLKNGLYVLDLGSNNLLPNQRSPRQLTEDDSNIDLATVKYIWSPDSSEVIIIGESREILLDVNRKVRLEEQPDIRLKKKQILSEWEEEMYLRERQYLAEFPDEMIEIATSSAKNVYISPDKKKLLYTVTTERDLPEKLTPPVPATSSQPEQRHLLPGHIYIYDREEDKNFAIGLEKGESDTAKNLLATDLFNDKAIDLISSPSAFQTLQASTSAQTAMNFSAYHSSLFINTLQWYSDSRHILYADNNTIRVMEYDGTNNNTVYFGPFAENFVYPWPDGSRLVILTAFSPDSPLNLYAIEIK